MENLENGKEIQEQIAKYEVIIRCMITLNEPLTIENLSNHMGVD